MCSNSSTTCERSIETYHRIDQARAGGLIGDDDMLFPRACDCPGPTVDGVQGKRKSAVGVGAVDRYALHAKVWIQRQCHIKSAVPTGAARCDSGVVPFADRAL